jgi:hypothetical protein
VLPRHLARSYFAAVDAFYICANDAATGKHWFLPGQVCAQAKESYIPLYSHKME